MPHPCKAPLGTNAQVSGQQRLEEIAKGLEIVQKQFDDLELGILVAWTAGEWTLNRHWSLNMTRDMSILSQVPRILTFHGATYITVMWFYCHCERDS